MRQPLASTPHLLRPQRRASKGRRSTKAQSVAGPRKPAAAVVAVHARDGRHTQNTRLVAACKAPEHTRQQRAMR